MCSDTVRNETARRVPRPQSGLGRTSLGGRDDAVFTSMRPDRPRAPGRPEFFTDSTNTSYIPTPSPAKPTTRGNANPTGTVRQVGTKSRVPTFRPNAQHNKENARPGVASPERSLSRASANASSASAKRGAVQVSAQGSPSPVARPEAISVRDSRRTPSPSRGGGFDALVSPISIVSESSPPRGLEETYRQIEEAENLAEQEDVDEEEELRNGDVLLQQNGARLQVHRRSESPSSRRSTRRSSPITGPGESLEAGVGAPTTAEEEVPSGASSPFEPIPQEVEASAAMLARDEQRVKDAIESDLPTFSKARKKMKSGLTVDNLRRQEEKSPSGSNSLKSHGSDSQSPSSKGSDLSLNIPSSWGRKARNGRRWMDPRTKGSKDNEGARLPPEAQRADSVEATSVDYWMEAAIAAPSPDTGEPLRSGPKDERNLSSSYRRRTSLEVFKRWESIDEEPATSPSKSRTAVLNAVKELEINRLTESALTTKGLGELKEKRSLDRVARRSLGIGEERPAVAEPPTSPPIKEESSVPVAKAADGSGEDPPSLKSTQVPADDYSSTTQVNKLDGGDSFDLLRRYTRASSNSPAHSRSRKAGSESSRGSERGPSPLAQGATASNPKEYAEGHTSRAVLTPDQLPIRSVEDRSASQKLDEGKEETKGTQPDSQLLKLVEPTPQAKQQKIYLKTPKVTGGWIDTPLPATGQLRVISEDLLETVSRPRARPARERRRKSLADELAEADEPYDDFDLESTAPRLPSSALAAIVDHAKAKKRGEAMAEGEDTLNLDDSTIESLEGLLENADTELPGQPGKEVSEDAGNSEGPHSALVNKLTHLQQSMSKTRHGLDKMGETLAAPPSPTKQGAPHQQSNPVPAAAAENQSSQPSEQKTSADESKSSATTASQKATTTSNSDKGATKKPKKNVQIQTPDETCDQAGEFHDFIWPCEACRTRAARVHEMEGHDDDNLEMVDWQTVQIPRLWTWKGKRGLKKWTPSLTTLGWVLLVLVGYGLAESIVSDRYTPPFYAATMDGFGVDYHMPRPPFVIPQLIWRSPYFGGIFRSIWFGSCVFMRLVAGILGVDAGVFGHGNHSGLRYGAYDGHVPSDVKWVFREAVYPAVAQPRAAEVEFVAEIVGIGADEVL